MSNTPRNNFALLQYYMRENLWCHAQSLAGDLAVALSDTTFLLWRAYASDRIGLAADALRDYKQCEGRRAVSAAAFHGLRQIYKRNRDKDGFDRTEAKLATEEKGTNYSALLQAALILWFSGETQRARDIANFVANSEADFRDEYTSVQLVRGWIELSVGKSTSVFDKCIQSFESVLLAESIDGLLDVDALMGKVHALERKAQFFPAQDLLNKCIVTHPNFSPAFLVKAKQLLRVEDFDQAIETVNRVLHRDAQNVEALILLAIMTIVREYKIMEACNTISELIRALKAREPRNWALALSCAQAFSRLSCGDSSILALTVSLVEMAQTIAPANSDVATELGYQFVLRGDPRSAKPIFQKAATSNDGNVAPLLGLIKCAVATGAYEDAHRQIEYVNENHPALSKHVELLALSAMIRWRKFRDQNGSLERLDQAIESHRLEVTSMPIGVPMFIKLNATLMLDIAREYIQHCRTEPVPGSNPDPIVEKTSRLLQMLLRLYPGCAEGQLLNAKTAFVNGDVEKAQRIIGQCLKLDSNNAEVFLLQARIAIYSGNLPPCAAALEQALALDFEIQDMPQFALLRGILLNQKQSYAEAQKILEGGLRVMKNITAAQTSKNATENQQKDPNNANKLSAANTPVNFMKYTGKNALISVQDHASIYLQLAQAQARQKQFNAAKETTSEAAKVFRDTLQAGRITIAQAMLVGRQDVEQALTILKQIPPTNPHFIAAKKQAAMLHLNVRGNRREYAKCFEELVEYQPTFDSFVALGDAYASISEPDKAITAFEKARAKDPNNALLAVKIGRTLVTTHDYQRALKYYRDAVAAERANVGLRTDLACLFWRLGDVDKAVSTLRDAPVNKKNPNTDDISAAKERVLLATVEAKILRSVNNSVGCAEALLQAGYHQNVVVQKLRNDPDAQFDQKKIASQICTELGEFYLAQKSDRAAPMFQDALRHDETNVKAMLLLARMYMTANDVDACENQCNDILRVAPTCEDATVMLADVTYRRNRFDDAAFHFQQLLDRAPENYSALYQFLNLLRKAGRLRDKVAEDSLKKAERALKPGQPMPQGLSFANGFHLRHTGRARESLTFFHQGRVPKDTEWGQKSVIAMIEIYLMPDGENLWEDTSAAAGSSGGDANNKNNNNNNNNNNDGEIADNILAAESLLPEVSDLDRRGVLQAYCMIASKRQDKLLEAVQLLTDLRTAVEARMQGVDNAGANENNNNNNNNTQQGDDGSGNNAASAATSHVPSLVGLAMAYHLLRNNPKVRNCLKLANRQTYVTEEEEDGERGMILLASTYIETGKMDMAQDLLNKALNQNKSSPRAWEMMGLINEKEQSYKDAADCYSNAYKLMNEADPHLGYKLSFNYLKAKRFVQAIDIAKKVLAQHPKYPRIQADVLDRARFLLKN